MKNWDEIEKQVLQDQESFTSYLIERGRREKLHQEDAINVVNRHSELVKMIDDYINKIQNSVLLRFEDHSKVTNKITDILNDKTFNNDPDTVTGEYMINVIYGHSFISKYKNLRNIEMENKKRLREQLKILKEINLKNKML